MFFYNIPLVDNEEFERAATLAEKYLDFETLVQICETTDNQHRLDEYMDRFSNQNFPEYVYTWYLEKNKRGKLIDRCRTFTKSRNVQKLTQFLSDHPSLAWMQNIYDRKFALAANTLRNLANDETDSIMRQKTLLSLSKLSKLADASAGDSFVQDVNLRLELVSFQEELPDYVLEQFGYVLNYFFFFFINRYDK